MANIKSAKKRIKITAKRTIINNVRKNKMRTAIRHLEDTVKTNAKEQALLAFKKAMSVIAKTAQKGVIHKNTAARKISKLNSKVKAIGQ